MKQIYGKALDSIGDYPSWSKDWRWVAAWCVIVYIVNLVFRLSFAGQWDHPELWVNGERILATHDAYFWLAKAKGIGRLAGYPIAQLAKFIHDYTGMGLGAVGFWMPAVVGSLVGVVCFLWGWLLGGKKGGIFAGLIGGLTPGFYHRTRLGYWDTDLFTLLMPMLITGLLAFWVSSYLRRGFFLRPDDDHPEENEGRSLWMALVFGVIIHWATIWHYDILNVTILSFVITGILIVAVGVPGNKVSALYGLAVLILAAIPGGERVRIGLWPFDLLFPFLSFLGKYFYFVLGLFLAVALVLLRRGGRGRANHIVNSPWFCVALFLYIVSATGVFSVPLESVTGRLSQYFFPAGTDGIAQAFTGPIYPSVVQSIIEARLVSIGEVLSRGAYWNWLGWFGLLASIAVVFFRPVAILLLPLIGLQIASMKLGIRFTMFGGAALIVCSGVAMSWITRAWLADKQYARIAGVLAQVCPAVVVLFVIFFQYANLPLTAVISKPHAEALVELGKEARSDSVVWTWWDWGYATMYYAGLTPVADGGKHTGKDVYPCAYAMSSHSPEKANRMVVVSSQYKDENPLVNGFSPAQYWDSVPRDKINAVLAKQLAKTDYPAQSPQYLVVSWKDLTISKWITYFGNWNLETGQTHQASLRLGRPGDLGFNLNRGVVQNRIGRGGLVSNIDVLDRGKVLRHHYGMNAISPRLIPGTPHLVANRVTGQTILADDKAYESMLFRLMTCDPDDPEIGKYFKLVIEKLPFVRIYEVVQK